MRILVDDDADTCDLLSLTLGAEGYEVRRANTAEEGLQLLGRAPLDLVILDVMLPHGSGWDVCRQMRTVSDVPILMISAFARTADDMARGLDSGADDYLAKPIDFDLLKAHVRALLRRSGQVDWRGEHPIYVDTHLTVDLRRQQVYVQGNPVRLSLLEYQLLEILVRNANQTVPALEIVEQLWPGQMHESTASLRTCTKRLRQAIEPEPHHPRYILGEYGLGYRFVPQTNIHKSVTIED